MRSVDGPQKDRARLEEPSRWRVLGEPWKRNLADLQADGTPVDLVVFTGDLADRGHATDYPRAIAFLKETCATLGVPLERLFLIPGNHDIDRSIQSAAWKSLRKTIRTEPLEHSRWMGDDPRTLRGNRRRDQLRDKIMERQRAFWEVVTGQLGRPELDPRQSPHGRLGYRQTVSLEGLAHPIHVIGLDTAWLAGDAHDGGELRLTEHQVALLTTEHGAPLSGFRIALMHHGLADLADGAPSRRLLADRVDLLLHGHQHNPGADLIQGPEHQLLILAAGCLYEGDEEHRYANACQVIDLVFDTKSRPLRAEIRFRGWSTRNYFWGDDALLYQSAPGGRLRLSYGPHGWMFASARGSARPLRAPERHEVFIGRDSELARIDAALQGGHGRVAIVALQGMAGVGKTYLAHEFYARYRERFGSYRHVVLDPEHPGTVARSMAVLGKQVGIDAAQVDEPAVAEVLRAQRALVHVDNVDSAPAALLVAELADALDDIPVLVTGRYTGLGTAAGSGWTRIELVPLDPEAALRLVQEELVGCGVEVAEADLRELVRQVAGLPLALHLASGYLRRGATAARFLERLRGAAFSLDPCDPADPLRRDRAKGVLSTSFAISRDAMLAEAGAEAMAWESALSALGWAPRAGFGRSLGAAITGLDEASGAFEDFIEAAIALSLARWLPSAERSDAAWTVHPLLGEFLRGDTMRDDVDMRISAWAAAQADDNPSERGGRWNALAAETASIGEWLGVALADVVGRTLPSACMFAMSRGPIAPWLAAARRVRDGRATHDLLWVICRLAFRAGEFETVLEAATAMEQLARQEGNELHRALARGRIANVLVARGESDEALRIYREQALPVYEQLGEERERANTLGKIADVLAARGEFDEALRIHREEALPIYERRGESWRRAYTLGRIADLIAARGEPDEALRIRREQVLPAYDHLGDVRSCVFTLGEIADVLADRGEFDEALRIRREKELPVYERLGDVQARAVTLGKIADMIARRGERDRALVMWREALAVFERLGNHRSIADATQRIAELETRSV